MCNGRRFFQLRIQMAWPGARIDVPTPIATVCLNRAFARAPAGGWRENFVECSGPSMVPMPPTLKFPSMHANGTRWSYGRIEYLKNNASLSTHLGGVLFEGGAKCAHWLETGAFPDGK